MRLQVLSDLHLEFGRFKPTITNADVVVLAGDIHQGMEGLKWAKQYCRDCPVIYVMGNRATHAPPQATPSPCRH
jgi:predicted phosphodiesterase